MAAIVISGSEIRHMFTGSTRKPWKYTVLCDAAGTPDTIDATRTREAVSGPVTCETCQQRADLMFRAIVRDQID
jgi:hypothetical protein